MSNQIIANWSIEIKKDQTEQKYKNFAFNKKKKPLKVMLCYFTFDIKYVLVYLRILMLI